MRGTCACTLHCVGERWYILVTLLCYVNRRISSSIIAAAGCWLAAYGSDWLFERMEPFILLRHPLPFGVWSLLSHGTNECDCNTPHHTTLHHAATHCNTPKQIATRCINMQPYLPKRSGSARVSASDNTCAREREACVHCCKRGSAGLPHTTRHCWELACAVDKESAHACNTLHRTATHCHALQHTASCCNAQQRTATHCNTTHCNTLPLYRVSVCQRESQRVCEVERELCAMCMCVRIIVMLKSNKCLSDPKCTGC